MGNDLHPAKHSNHGSQTGRGLVDYEKVFCPDPRAGDIFDVRGVDRANGCAVIVRPDQYIANILPLDAYARITAFLDGFMMQARGALLHGSAQWPPEAG